MTKACRRGSAREPLASEKTRLIQVPDGVNEECGVEREQGDQTGDGIERNPGSSMLSLSLSSDVPGSLT